MTDLTGALQPPEWTEEALCAQADPEAFFPEKGRRDTVQAARKVCAACPVRQECLAFALEHDQRFGIWGGLTERELRKIRRQRGGKW